MKKESSQAPHYRDEKDTLEDSLYTVEEAVQKIGYGYFQVLITLFCGTLWVVDATEIMLLSILSSIVNCQWNLSDSEEALITSVVFVGFLIGGLFWGVLLHIWGRKTGLLLVNLVILTFGVLSAIKVSPADSKIPGYPWLLVCRFFVGFGAGGTGQAVTYYTEFLPLQGRGFCVVMLGAWWGIGTMLGAVLAVGVLGESDLGWHWYLGLAAIPLAIALLFFPFIPESARFYLVKGKGHKAQKVIERIAWLNCKEVPRGRVVSHEEKQAKNEPKQEYLELLQTLKTEEKRTLLNSKTPKLKQVVVDLTSLFTDGMWKTTTILLFVWFGVAWLYYGVVLLTTTLLKTDPHCDGFNVTSNYSNDSVSVCEELDTGNYINILWTAAAELPGVFITMFLVEIIGRKITMAVEFIICMIGILLLFICGPVGLITFFLFIIRAFAIGVFQTVYIYTAEIYPTSNRSIGFGICIAAARAGCIATSYAAQVLFYVSDYATLSLYAGSCLVLAVLALLLPIETKGRPLHDKETAESKCTDYCCVPMKCKR